MLSGYDAKDPVTAACAARPKISYARHTGAKSLRGKRLGVLRDLMIEASLVDRENIRVPNEAITAMKKAGATIVDPLNVDKTIADLITVLEPGCLKRNFPAAFLASAKPIEHIVSMALDQSLFPPAPTA